MCEEDATMSSIATTATSTTSSSSSGSRESVSLGLVIHPFASKGVATVSRCEDLKEIIRKFDHQRGGTESDNYHGQNSKSMENVEDNRHGDGDHKKSLSPSMANPDSIQSELPTPQCQPDVFKNEKNFTMSVKEFQYSKNKRRHRHRKGDNKVDRKHKKREQSINDAEIDAKDANNNKDHHTIEIEDIIADIQAKENLEAPKLESNPSKLELLGGSKITHLNFDIVTVGKKGAKKKSSRKVTTKNDVTIVWNRSKTLLLLWTVVALVLWIITYMILRLCFII